MATSVFCVAKRLAKSRAMVLLASVTLAMLLASGGALTIGTQPAQGAFPGINGKIAFVSTRDGNEEIYVMNADGTNETRLTTEPGRDVHPMFSPDGKRITFTRRPLAGVIEETIYLMAAKDLDPEDGNGDDLIKLTPAPSPNFQSAFSPDGKRIAFVHQESIGDGEIYVMNADGTNPVPLTDNTVSDFKPAFSPDGTKIVYNRSESNSTDPSRRRPDVYVMDADGTEQTRLTDAPMADSNPSFSPDGEKIVFQSARDGNVEIYAMNPDGTEQTRLTFDPNSSEEFPVFSPDGKQLAFSSDRDGNAEVYVTNADASAAPIPLTETEFPTENTRVDWGPFLYDCVGRPLATLKTQLSGDKEEPGPGDPDGTGRAVIKVFRAQVFFALTVENIEPATAAHIHLGLRDEAGPVVAPLVPPPTGGSSSACVDIPRALSLELREHPFRYYVNVHNEEFPNGAVRGQLHR